MLETALAKRTESGLPGNKVMALLVTELVTTGRATLPNGTVLEASPRDWIETVKWVYAHVDGPPKQELELSGELTMAKGYTRVSPDDWSEPEATGD